MNMRWPYLLILVLLTCSASAGTNSDHGITTQTAVVSETVISTSNQSSVFTTRSGTTYDNARISRVEPDGVTIVHSRGIAKVPMSDLPEELQKRYNYNPTAARAYSEASYKAQRQFIEEQQKGSPILSGAASAFPVDAYNISAKSHSDTTVVTGGPKYDTSGMSLKDQENYNFIQAMNSKKGTTRTYTLTFTCKNYSSTPQSVQASAGGPSQSFTIPANGKVENITVPFDGKSKLMLTVSGQSKQFSIQ